MTPCTRNGLATFNAMGTLLVLGTVVWGIAVVNNYIVLQQGLTDNLAAYELDTTTRINQRIAAEAALLLQIETTDAELQVSISGINDTLSAQIAYLASVLNVTSGSATTFIETVQALVQLGLADRLQTINSVPGTNDTLDNIDLVSLSPSNLAVVPDAGTNSIGLSLSGLVTDINAGNAGINATRVGSVVTVSNAGVLSTQGCTGAVTYVASGALAIWADTEASTVTFDSSAIEAQLDALNATVSGLGTVTSVDTGVGLTGGPFTTNGTVALADTAVTPGAYTNADVTVDQQGRITSIANGASAGGVTSIDTGVGLSGGPITVNGTIQLADTAVTPGTYTNANVTVDQQGRITAVSSGSSSGSTSLGYSTYTFTAPTLVLTSAAFLFDVYTTTTGNTYDAGTGVTTFVDAGTYLVTAQLTFSPSASMTSLSIVTNGTGIPLHLGTTFTFAAASGVIRSAVLSGLIVASAGNTLDLLFLGGDQISTSWGDIASFNSLSLVRIT